LGRPGLQPFAAFSTENPENIEKKEASAADRFSARLAEKQVKQLLPVLKAVVLGMKGPPQVGELEQAKEYARQLAAGLVSGGKPLLD
jgi:hypothetical protein